MVPILSIATNKLITLPKILMCLVMQQKMALMMEETMILSLLALTLLPKFPIRMHRRHRRSAQHPSLRCLGVS